MKPLVRDLQAAAHQACRRLSVPIRAFRERGLDEILEAAEDEDLTAQEMATELLTRCCLEGGTFNNFMPPLLAVMEFLGQAISPFTEQMLRDLRQVLINPGTSPVRIPWLGEFRLTTPQRHVIRSLFEAACTSTPDVPERTLLGVAGRRKGTLAGLFAGTGAVGVVAVQGAKAGRPPSSDHARGGVVTISVRPRRAKTMSKPRRRGQGGPPVDRPPKVDTLSSSEVFFSSDFGGRAEPAKAPASAPVPPQEAKREPKPRQKEATFEDFGMTVYEAVCEHAKREEPPEPGMSTLWPFIRDIKKHPLITALAARGGDIAGTAFTLTYNAIVQFTAPGVCPWEHHLDVGDEDAAVDFARFWHRIRFTGDFWDDALERAAACMPNTLSPQPRRTKKWPLFVGFCAQLQMAVGADWPHMPQEKIVGVKQGTISAYIRLAQEEGWLRLISAHVPPRDGRPGTAAGYLVGIHFCPTLRARADPALIEWLSGEWPE